jgi:hypothetical protein
MARPKVGVLPEKCEVQSMRMRDFLRILIWSLNQHPPVHSLKRCALFKRLHKLSRAGVAIKQLAPVTGSLGKVAIRGSLLHTKLRVKYFMVFQRKKTHT